MNPAIKKYSIQFGIACILIASFLGGFYYYSHIPNTGIYNFNERRDSAFILDIFKKNWYWLIAEGSDFSPEHMLKYRASSKNPEDIGNETIKVLYDQKEPVGFVVYRKKKFYEGFIHFVAVDEKARSKGYGLQLVKYAVQDLIKQGMKKITLVTRTNNIPAQTIYKKAGFQETKIVNGFVYFAYYVS